LDAVNQQPGGVLEGLPPAQMSDLQRSILDQLANQVTQLSNFQSQRAQEQAAAFWGSPQGQNLNRIQSNLDFIRSDFFQPTNGGAVATRASIGKLYGGSVEVGNSLISTFNNLATKSVDSCSNTQTNPLVMPTTNRLNTYESSITDLSKIYLSIIGFFFLSFFRFF
jgi:hypothetical protein